jgi:hypothetical protein
MRLHRRAHDARARLRVAMPWRGLCGKPSHCIDACLSMPSYRCRAVAVRARQTRRLENEIFRIIAEHGG